MHRFLIAIMGLAIALGLMLLRRQATSSLPSNRIDGLVFEDGMHGFAQLLQNPRSIYETTNAGKSWLKSELGVTGFRAGRSFANAMQGWSVDEDTKDHGHIFQTDDGGHSWKSVFDTGNPNDLVFGGIQALSPAEIWVTGLSGTYHSSDGGKTWQKNGPPGTGLQFLDLRQGWVVGDRLWYTPDAGKSWEPVEKDEKSCFGGLGFFFLDRLHGWAVGGEEEHNIEGGATTGLVSYTADGGKTCSEIARVPGKFFWSVFFLNDKQGWVGGIGSVLKTEDGGHTWIPTTASP